MSYKILGNRLVGRIARKIQEGSISIQGSNSYSIKDTSVDIFNLATYLVSKGLSKPNSSSIDKIAISDNIQQLSVNLLRPKVANYNTKITLYTSGKLGSTIDTVVNKSNPDRSFDVDANIGNIQLQTDRQTKLYNNVATLDIVEEEIEALLQSEQ